MVIEKENTTDKIINLIFPNVCGICGKISENSLCKKCENTLKKYIIIKQEEIQNRNYNELISYFNYNGIIRNNILNYKFKEKPFFLIIKRNSSFFHENPCSFSSLFLIIEID